MFLSPSCFSQTFYGAVPIKTRPTFSPPVSPPLSKNYPLAFCPPVPAPFLLRAEYFLIPPPLERFCLPCHAFSLPNPPPRLLPSSPCRCAELANSAPLLRGHQRPTTPSTQRFPPAFFFLNFSAPLRTLVILLPALSLPSPSMDLCT